MEAPKQAVVAFLTLSSDSSAVAFVDDIKKELPEHIFNHVPLSNDVLKSFHMKCLGENNAAVLFHSVQEGRHSITDVPDAKYNALLPQLKKKFGAGRVAVVVYSMPSLQQSYNRDPMMMAFADSQPTTFQCSSCVIQCNNLDAMDTVDRHRLISFLTRIGKEYYYNDVALLYYPEPNNCCTQDLLSVLKPRLPGFNLKSLDEKSVKLIRFYKAVLVLAPEEKFENEDMFDELHARYKIALEGQCGWLITEKTDKSGSLRDCYKPNIFVYIQGRGNFTEDESTPDGKKSLLGSPPKHEKYGFEESTLNRMKSWLTEDCRLVKNTNTGWRGWLRNVPLWLSGNGDHVQGAQVAITGK